MPASVYTVVVRDGYCNLSVALWEPAPQLACHLHERRRRCKGDPKNRNWTI